MHVLANVIKEVLGPLPQMYNDDGESGNTAKMAEIMTDKELREELVAFGETNLGPITGTTRALYLKKLNHYRARAKVPGKKGSSAPVSKKLLGFSSDESGDDAGPSTPVGRRRGRAAKNSKPAPEPRPPLPTYDSQHKRRVSSGLRRRPLRSSARKVDAPEENGDYEDEDSVPYPATPSSLQTQPVDTHSFNIQTSLNTTFTVDDTVDSPPRMPSHDAFESSDSDIDPIPLSGGGDEIREDFDPPFTSTQRQDPVPGGPVSRRPVNPYGQLPSSTPIYPRHRGNLPSTSSSSPPQIPPVRRHIVPQAPAAPSKKRPFSIREELNSKWPHYISMFLLVLAGLFFLCLAFMYITMRSNVTEEDPGSKYIHSNLSS